MPPWKTGCYKEGGNFHGHWSNYCSADKLKLQLPILSEKFCWKVSGLNVKNKDFRQPYNTNGDPCSLHYTHAKSTNTPNVACDPGLPSCHGGTRRWTTPPHSVVTCYGRPWGPPGSMSPASKTSPNVNSSSKAHRSDWSGTTGHILAP